MGREDWGWGVAVVGCIISSYIRTKEGKGLSVLFSGLVVMGHVIWIVIGGVAGMAVVKID